MLKNEKMKNIRNILLMLAFIIAYISAFTMGAISVIEYPALSQYINLTIFLLSALGILFITLFYGLYQNNIDISLDDRNLQIVELYGQGKSFQHIKDKLDLPSIATVKQELIKFCKLKS